MSNNLSKSISLSLFSLSFCSLVSLSILYLIVSHPCTSSHYPPLFQLSSALLRRSTSHGGGVKSVHELCEKQVWGLTHKNKVLPNGPQCHKHPRNGIRLKQHIVYIMNKIKKKIKKNILIQIVQVAAKTCKYTKSIMRLYIEKFLNWSSFKN